MTTETNTAKMKIRRDSDDAELTVDLSTEKDRREAQKFCEGGDGRISYIEDQD